MNELGDWASDTRPVRAFLPNLVDGSSLDAWPATVPAARQLLREGIELKPGITVLVGENGSGKSTVVEMLAEAYGLSPQGGSILAPGSRLRESEPGRTPPACGARCRRAGAWTFSTTA